MQQILIAGGGIGGLSAALACHRAGWRVCLHERASAFAEVGAGVQLGPNAVRCLDAWGLMAPLRAVACFPEVLQVRSAFDGTPLAGMRLGRTMVERYGAAYATVHRADLHDLLLQAVRGLPDVQLHLCHRLMHFSQERRVVSARVRTADGGERQIEADALLGADGLHSRVRAVMLGRDAEETAGHVAYRAVVPQEALPPPLRSPSVTVWLGPRLHVVHYPVRRGEWLNVVVIREGPPPAEVRRWDHAASAGELQSALVGACAALRDLVHAVPAAGGEWRLWPLALRAPVAGVHEMAQGAVALLGDAAHPMRPYLAQGAGMAIEDAVALEQALAMQALDVHERLRRYALGRWQRVARVQRRSQRNGHIFHATGPLRLARDASLRLLGERVMDMPWLYGGGPLPVSRRGS